MKRKIYFILIINVLGFNSYSQDIKKMPGDSVIIPTIARPLQEMPYFTGGATALQAFFKTNIHYPKQAIKDKLEGRAIVSFVIEKDGSLSTFKLRIDPGDGLGDEAIRILKLSPKWSPGKLDNQLVRVQFAIPVNFNLPKVTP